MEELGYLLLLFLIFIIECVLIYKPNSSENKKPIKEKIIKNVSKSYSYGISRELFEAIVMKSKRRIKRLRNVSVNGTTVYGTVISQKGITEWNFQIDFNDCGHITGNYLLTSENGDSNIPERFANRISTIIQEHLETSKYNVGSNIMASDNINQEDEFDYEQNQDNIMTMRQQVDSFKKRECKPLKKKFSSFLVYAVAVVIIVAVGFVAYKVWEYKKEINVSLSSSQAISMNYEQVVDILEKDGFTNINTYPEYDLELAEIENENTVVKVTIKGKSDFDTMEKYPYDAPIEITYHVLKEINMPVSSKEAGGMMLDELVSQFEEAGFANIITSPDYDLITGWLNKEYSVESVSINGEENFSVNSSYRPNDEILIVYHRFKKDKE
jgi:nitrate reductase NapE component